MKLADLIEENAAELAAIEALDNGERVPTVQVLLSPRPSGKTFGWASSVDIPGSVACIRYYAGWADKNHGKTIETSEVKLAYTRHEPIGVVVRSQPTLLARLGAHPPS